MPTHGLKMYAPFSNVLHNHVEKVCVLNFLNSFQVIPMKLATFNFSFSFSLVPLAIHCVTQSYKQLIKFPLVC